MDNMRFSQRMGKVPASKQIQLETIDDDLKNGLWNAIKIIVLDPLEDDSRYSNSQFKSFCTLLWHHHYKLALDTMPTYRKALEHFIKESFYNVQWFESYDLLEFLANVESNSFHIESEEFTQLCNEILEKEFSGYRFINGNISPITNSNEINEIEEAINQSGHFTALKGVNIHLKSALEKLSDKKSPDFRNSIKESISAIESVAKVISENSKDTLGGALDKIKGRIKLHASLERGFKQIYGYTSDSGGIRHALMDEDNCDFEDAKYMLVSCSSFINYLIAKANKVGITFE